MTQKFAIPFPGALVAAALLVLPFASLRAQQTGNPPASPTPAAPALQPPATASLEDRIAAARSVKVTTAILGIELGSELDEAHEKLDKLCAPGTRPKEEGEDDEVEESKAKGRESGEQKKEDGEERERKPKIGEEAEEGHKVLWTLAGTDYSAIYITADDKERIDSITGFLRPEKRMPFEAVGEVAKAPIKNNSSVVWDVLRMDQPLFRVVAQGADGKADTIRIVAVRRRAVVGASYPREGKSK